MPTNIEIKLRKKTYNSSTDSGDGIIVFDPTNRDIHVGGIEMYPVFTGTDGTNAGTKGIIPAPTANDNGKVLSANGTWVSVGGGGGTVNDGVLTLTKNGVNTTFTANQAGNSSLDVDVEWDYWNNSSATPKKQLTISNKTYNSSTDAGDGVIVFDTTSGSKNIYVGGTSMLDVFTGTDGTNAGIMGFVPAPTAADSGKVLSADGIWITAGGGSADAVLYTAQSETLVRQRQARNNIGISDTLYGDFKYIMPTVVDVDLSSLDPRITYVANTPGYDYTVVLDEQNTIYDFTTNLGSQSELAVNSLTITMTERMLLENIIFFKAGDDFTVRIDTQTSGSIPMAGYIGGTSCLCDKYYVITIKNNVFAMAEISNA